MSPASKKNDEFSMTYMDDFRDATLRINDDKKIQIGLGGISQVGTTILLLVKENATAGRPVSEEQLNRAWFRLSNEDTN